MEIRQLKYFLKVAETLNFSEASRKLYITQSTLSQQISHLEQEIGLPLFERNSHEVYLTEAGKELRPYAQNAVNSAEACVDHMNDLKEMLTGELNIGVTFSFSNIMSETLIAFLHAYPHVKLNIQYRTMQELMDGLKKRELDLVLAFKPLKKRKGGRQPSYFQQPSCRHRERESSAGAPFIGQAFRSGALRPHTSLQGSAGTQRL